jgi:hypothetical protein
MPAPARPSEPKHETRLNRERVRQIRGLMLLAFIVLVFAIWRAGLDRVFTPGWWRLW